MSVEIEPHMLAQLLADDEQAADLIQLRQERGRTVDGRREAPLPRFDSG